MSDKLKAAADAATPVVEVVTGGVKAAANAAPVVVETGAETVEVIVDVVEKMPVSKKLVIGAVALVGLSAIAGGVAYFAARRQNAKQAHEIADETAHAVVEEMTKPAAEKAAK